MNIERLGPINNQQAAISEARAQESSPPQEIQQELILKQLQNYLCLRNPNLHSRSSFRLEDGLCYGLTQLFGYYCFINKKRRFYDRIRNVLSIDMKKLTDMSAKTFSNMTAEQLELERMANDVIFLQTQQTNKLIYLPEVLQFASDKIKKINLAASATFTHIYPAMDHSSNKKRLIDNLSNIATRGKGHTAFVKLNIANSIHHTIGFFCKKTKLYFYDSNVPNQVPPFKIKKGIARKISKVVDHIFKYYITATQGYTSITFDITTVNPLKPHALFEGNLDDSNLLSNEEIMFEKLTAAVIFNDIAEVIRLLKAGINPRRLPSTESPLSNSHLIQEATDRRHMEIIEMLLENGADVNQTNTEGESALYRAAFCGHDQSVDLLLKHGANIHAVRPRDSSTALNAAAAKGNASTVELLLKAGAKATLNPVTQEHPLWLAAAFDHADVIDVLLTHGIPVDMIGSFHSTPLQVAAEKGHYSAVKKLVEAGAKINALAWRGKTPLWIAAQNGHSDIVQLLIDRGAAVNTITGKHCTPPLWEAAANNHPEVVIQLLQHKADINAIGTHYTTPLWIAASHGYVDVVKLLLKAGANFQLTDSQLNCTPLQVAAGLGHKKVVKVLSKLSIQNNTNT